MDRMVFCIDGYDDDPREIALGIAKFVRMQGKRDGENLFVILDRRAGIEKALALAQKDDIVLITGKGSEQSMVLGGKNIPWDDRDVTRESIRALHLQ